jgi:hypothetical protein
LLNGRSLSFNGDLAWVTGGWAETKKLFAGLTSWDVGQRSWQRAGEGELGAEQFPGTTDC